MIVDSRIGGFGDVWMRLLALFTLNRLTGQKVGILINRDLVPMAQALFGTRIQIASEGEGDFIYTHYGLRHLLGGMLRGKQYILPFYWVMKANRQTTSVKDRVNDGAILTTARAGLIHLPDRRKTHDYQGYMELTAFPPFRHVSYEEFCRESFADLAELQARLKAFGSSLKPQTEEAVVYPSGSAHQGMPVEWAAQNLPDALFAFHERDSFADEFEKGGLRVTKFGTPLELFQVGLGARRIFCTDSFPSHFWQVYGTNVVLLMTEQTRDCIVHPAFPSEHVISSRAACSPCRHLMRGNDNAPCAMGYSFCLTWNDQDYNAAFAGR